MGPQVSIRNPKCDTYVRDPNFNNKFFLLLLTS
ncbi:MAG: hypothetical protein KatS3mg130_1085 [Candidatus Sumerlaea sp.]|jgi:hypothetical protein|nr:MAG: hypothetical protein KatS3mg130_1085 [Candidatus Sumerlaea sp.]